MAYSPKTISGKMAISDLSDISGIPVSTIKFYIRNKLLHRPIKTAATRGFYTLRHLDRLRLIKKIQKEGNMPLKKIQEITEMIDSSESEELRDSSRDGSSARSKIMDAAIDLFRKKGYKAVSIAEIVDVARIGCSTFYRNFANKKELFIACIRKTINADELADDLGEIFNEGDMFKAVDNAVRAIEKTSPVWRDMMDQLRAAAINDPDEFADQLEKVIQLKIQAFERLIEKAIAKGFVRNLNETVLAVMLFGVEDACSQYSFKRQFDDSQREALINEIKDILLRGIMKK